MHENEISIEELFTVEEGSADRNVVETAEFVGVGESLFNQRMDSLENLLLINFVCSALLVGCMLASIVIMWFHKR